MRLGFKFQNLCGTVYKCGNVVFTSDGGRLLSPVGNRVTCFDLVHHSSVTFAFESRKNVARLALSPDDKLLLIVDVEGRALVASMHSRRVLHRFNFKAAVKCVAFSPCGRYIAASHDSKVQVWHTPPLRRDFSPFELHKQYGGHYDAVTALCWSPCSRFLVTGSRDRSLRVHAVGRCPGFTTITLTGHREPIANCFWVNDPDPDRDLHSAVERGASMAAARARLDPSESGGLCTVSKDGGVFVWRFERVAPPDADGADGGGGGARRHSRQKLSRHRQRHRGKRRSGDGGGDGAEEGEDGRGAGLPLLRLCVDGQWRLYEKHFVQKEGATIKSAALSARKAAVSAADFKMPNGREGAEEEEGEDGGGGGGGGGSSGGGGGAVVAGRTAAAEHDEASAHQLLVVGFSTGAFGLYQLPDCACIHMLSVSQHQLTTSAVTASGDWLAIGSATLGQLLVWEWRSETYVLKQQGHEHGLECLAYSPDSSVIATGGHDSKVKLWDTATGFCFVTFPQHTAAVRALAFVGASGHALVSASLDGTVRAFDLVRYRNFRVMTTPRPAQLLSLAVDGAGEVVVAGAMEPFEIYVWSLQTGRLLDVLTGHEAPVSCLAFSPTEPLLASGSWDRTAKIWDLYKQSTPVDSFANSGDVLAVAFRPDGKELATSALGGLLHFWDVREGVAVGEISARRDITGGRREKDLFEPRNSDVGKALTSLAYTADGACVLGGGQSKWVVLYDVGQRLLLRKWQLSHNRSLDGVLDKLHTRNLAADAGASLASFDLDASDDDEDGAGGRGKDVLPGAATGEFSKRNNKVEVRSTCVRFSPAGSSWAVASTAGLLIFSLDAGATFSPYALDLHTTPTAVRKLLAAARGDGVAESSSSSSDVGGVTDAAATAGGGKFLRALLMSLHLGDETLVCEVFYALPAAATTLLAGQLPQAYLGHFLEFLAGQVKASPHLEFTTAWCKAVLQAHGPFLQKHMTAFLAAFRAIQKALLRHADYLAPLCDRNKFALQFLERKAAVAAAPSASQPRGRITFASAADDDGADDAGGVGGFEGGDTADSFAGEEEDQTRGVDFFGAGGGGGGGGGGQSRQAGKAAGSSALDDVDDLPGYGGGGGGGADEDEDEPGLAAFMSSFGGAGGWAAPTE